MKWKLLEIHRPTFLRLSCKNASALSAGRSPWLMAFTNAASPINTSWTRPARPHGNTGYLPHPHGPRARRSPADERHALCIPAKSRRGPGRRTESEGADRLPLAPPAQNAVCLMNGSRTAPSLLGRGRPRGRRLLPITRRTPDVHAATICKFWPRPPIPPDVRDHHAVRQRNCNDMLRGLRRWPRTRWGASMRAPKTS